MALVLGIGALTGFFRDAFDLTGYQTGMVVTAVALAPLFALVFGVVLLNEPLTLQLVLALTGVAAGIDWESVPRFELPEIRR